MIVPFLGAFCAALVLVPLMARAADRIGWVSPSHNCLGRHPAMSGGLTIGILVATLVLLLEGPQSFLQMGGFWLGFLLAGGLGLIDDSLGLSPLGKLLLQIVVGASTLFCMTLPGGLVIEPLQGLALLFWIVALMNAFNLLDNMDGIAGGVALINCLALVLLFLPGSGPEALLLALLAGTLLGFLVYNSSPARVYLGDTGSHLIGFTLSVMSIHIAASRAFALPVEVALVMVVLVSLLDTLFVIVRRSAEGRPFYHGGKDHFSHWLLARGMSERGVALVFYALATFSSLLAFVVSGGLSG